MPAHNPKNRDELGAFLEAYEAYFEGGEGVLPSIGSMDRLRHALTTTSERVEIQRHVGQASASLRAAQDTARLAAARNAEGSRIARVLGPSGRLFECAVSAEQARELILAGAVEK